MWAHTFPDWVVFGIIIIAIASHAFRGMARENREFKEAFKKDLERREQAERRLEEYERERKEAMELHELGWTHGDIAAKLKISTDRVDQHIHSEDWTNGSP
jgi:DNA-directed RNA polymerase specialized sigma24 family protein